MVILGLGSNLGDRLKQLRRALSLLQQLPDLTIKQVSPLYISDALLPDAAPTHWNTPYLNVALRCETKLSPHELLDQTKKIEQLVGRQPEKNWGPRIIDIDILAWDDLILYDKKLHIPHEYLHQRPFALWPLTDVAPRWIYPLPGPHQKMTATEISAPWGSRFTGEAPLHTQQVLQRIDTPALVGIINITPDSFSDGGKFLNIAEITEYASQLVASGAEILDIGAEATGPKATPIDSTTEWKRLEPVLKAILHQRPHMLIPPHISIDTRHADVAEKALKLGADWINDISGFADPKMIDVLKHHTCQVIFMHHLGIPVAQQTQTIPIQQDPIPTVLQWGEEQIIKLEKNGIHRERIIFDVGIGYGKTAEQSVELIQHIQQFKNLGVNLLVGHSRKSFLNLYTTKIFAERDIETLTASLFLAKHSVEYLRVHNVNDHARAFKVAMSLEDRTASAIV